MSKEDDAPFFEVIGPGTEDDPPKPKPPASEEKTSSQAAGASPEVQDEAPASSPNPFFEVIGGAAQDDAKASGSPPPAEERLPPPAPEPLESGRLRLKGLSARAYEHPADRAAMSALRKVPGLDMLLRKLIALIGERSLRFLYLASAVRVSERQYPEVYRAYLEVCKVLDLEHPPELFVAQTPLVNAGAIGVEEPFIVLNSGTVQMLSIDELRVVMGHELGHILSDHVLYKTMLRLLMSFSLASIGIPLGGLALFGIRTALLEWDRKSELSCDRAALLSVQDPRLCYSVHMKLAGGSGELDIDAFIEQAEEYERAGSVVDGMFKLLNLVGSTHPFHVTRLAELRHWVEQGRYGAILEGDYPRRDEAGNSSVYHEIKDGAAAYREDYERSEDPLMKFLGDVGTTVSDAASNAWSSTRDFFGRIRGGDK